MTAAFRCAAASEEAAEQVAGSASTVPAFLLVEAPGPWGVDAVRDSRLPDEVKGWLGTLESGYRVRPLLIRGHGRQDRTTTRVFAAYVRGRRPWVEAAELDDVGEITSLDVSELAKGRSPGLTPYDGPLFLVCTHGRHDACCAERGRPVCRALSQLVPQRAWEVSHIGGDRFAANVLVLPHGLYYGRVTAEDSSRLVDAHLSGRLDLDRLRGRCALPFPVQAAEIYLRRHLDLTEVAPLTRVATERAEPETAVTFEVAGERWQVRVRTGYGEQRQLTCRALRQSRPLVQTPLSVERVPGGP